MSPLICHPEIAGLFPRTIPTPEGSRVGSRLQIQTLASEEGPLREGALIRATREAVEEPTYVRSDKTESTQTLSPSVTFGASSLSEGAYRLSLRKALTCRRLGAGDPSGRLQVSE